jgi:hypothetical protein
LITRPWIFPPGSDTIRSKPRHYSYHLLTVLSVSFLAVKFKGGVRGSRLSYISSTVALHSYSHFSISPTKLVYLIISSRT